MIAGQGHGQRKARRMIYALNVACSFGQRTGHPRSVGAKATEGIGSVAARGATAFPRFGSIGIQRGVRNEIL